MRPIPCLNVIDKKILCLSDVVDPIHMYPKSIEQIQSKIADIILHLEVLSTQLHGNVEVSKDHKMMVYTTAFSALTQHTEMYDTVQSLTELIYKWYVVRFCSDRYLVNGYNTERFHEWVENFVIGFGKHLYNGTLDAFVLDITTWCSSVLLQNDQYIVPKTVYKYSTDLQITDVSLSALVIWDILYDNGLKDIDDTFKKSAIFNRFSMFNSDFNGTENYTSYKLNPSVLSIAKIL